MYQLTRNRKYMLKVDLEDFEGRKGFALYSFFSVGCECAGYQLGISGFTDGGAGKTLSIILMKIHFHWVIVFSDALPLCRRLFIWRP